MPYTLFQGRFAVDFSDLVENSITPLEIPSHP
jgi:hypothetical protein